ncbi:TPA: hypothetical protein ACW4ES_004848, partial [Salmonella enterica subsp. enterica serovar Schwarzengrund]
PLPTPYGFLIIRSRTSFKLSNLDLMIRLPCKKSDDQIKMPQKRQKNIAIFNNRLMNNPIPHPLIMRHFLSQKPSILKNL